MACSDFSGAVINSAPIRLVQTADCRNSISALKNKAAVEATVGYGTDKLWDVKQPTHQFFSVKNRFKCPIKKCSLLAKCGAPAPYAGDKATLSSDNQFLQIKNDDEKGFFGESVCLSCTNSNDDSDAKPVETAIKLTQVGKAESSKMVGTLKTARNNFLNYFSWSLVHGLVTKTTEKCE